VDVEEIKVEEPVDVVISAEQENQPEQDVKPETEPVTPEGTMIPGELETISSSSQEIAKEPEMAPVIPEEIMTPEKKLEEILRAEDTLTPEQTEPIEVQNQSDNHTENEFTEVEELPVMTPSGETNTPEEFQPDSEGMTQGDQETAPVELTDAQNQSDKDMEDGSSVAEELLVAPSADTNIEETPEELQLGSEGMAQDDQEIAQVQPTDEQNQSTNDMENEFPVVEELPVTSSGETNIEETPEESQLDSEGTVQDDQEIVSEEPTDESDQSDDEPDLE
jgi:hypothetical protein